jgi:hypothetical protein
LAPFFIGGRVEQFAVFVDAGYLYGEGGKVCYDTSDRGELLLDFGKSTEALADIGRSHSGLRHLRTYWYDAATNRVPTPSHIAVASLRRVNLRLGLLTNLGQKGVDSLIVRDLMVLSRERAVAAVYLLAGDEDLREGVREAKDMGVSVILIGIEPRPGDRNQSPDLVREADDLLILTSHDLKQYLQRRSPIVPVQSPVSGANPTEVGRRFAQEWAAKVSPEVVERVRARRPFIPADIDHDLLTEAQSVLGRLDQRPEERQSLRSGFWDGLDHSLRMGQEGDGSDL